MERRFGFFVDPDCADPQMPNSRLPQHKRRDFERYRRSSTNVPAGLQDRLGRAIQTHRILTDFQ